MLIVTDMLGALKHHVFEEMCKAGTARFFTSRTDMVGNIYPDNWIGMVFMNHQSKSVLQLKFTVGDEQLIIIGSNAFQQGNADRNVICAYC